MAATRTGCTGSGAGQLIELYGYDVAGAITKRRLRIVRSSGTVDKDVSYSYGSDGKLATVLYPGATVPYTYSYDQGDRPIKMTGPPTLLGTTTVDHVKDVTYGAAGNVTGMKYLHWQDSGTPHYFTEQKDFNGLFQMTRQRTWVEGVVPPLVADIEYGFSSTANNGQILTRKNNVRSGETFTYQYDELNRLISATSSAGWTQSFDMDGFGNLWSQTMSSGGSATPMSVTFDMTKNRINSSGWSFDDNGNTTSMPTSGGSATLTYDFDNRLTSWSGPAGVENYGYLADNKRVWKKSPSGVETVYFYGAGGQKLLTYTLQASPLALVGPSENIYFGGKLIRANGVAVVSDRLGSVIARSGCGDCSTVAAHEYLPYGEEMGTAAAGNSDKFGTYHRDQTTALDYADQRYFSGTMAGRFLTADPYAASGGASEPGSWNRYPYVGGDPVNFADPSGLEAAAQDLLKYDGDNKECAGAFDKMKEAIFGKKDGDRVITKGLKQRVQEQIYGRYSPTGSPVEWRNHDEKLKDMQRMLVKGQNRWDSRGCGPRPPWTVGWDLETVRPTPEQYQGPGGLKITAPVIRPEGDVLSFQTVVWSAITFIDMVSAAQREFVYSVFLGMSQADPQAAPVVNGVADSTIWWILN